MNTASPADGCLTSCGEETRGRSAGGDYWINGLVLATVARIVSESKGVRAGLHFLADAVDPIAFMTELRKAGVDQIENFQQYAL